MGKETVHLIVNPVAGHGKAPEVVASHVIPILDHFSIPYKQHITTAPRDAGHIGQSISKHHHAASSESGDKITVIIAGGDGTTHDFIEGVLDLTGKGQGQWEIVILPLGTANALYSSLFPPSAPSPTYNSLKSLSHPPPDDILPKLYSLFAYLDKSSSPLSLPITLTSLLPPEATPANQETDPCSSTIVVPSHVVLSTSLHASILQISETLRSAHPGPERFRLAAQQSASKFFDAKAKLFPTMTTIDGSGGGEVEQWDLRKGKFVKPFTTTTLHTEKDGGHILDGPFAYFLSTSTVDRLEPTFVISPPTSLHPDTSTDIHAQSKQRWIYLTVLRPLRDPAVSSSSPEERGEIWSKRAFEVLGQAYQQGSHINLTYSTNATATEVKGEGEVVVELFRCGSFEWIPLDNQQRQEGEGDGSRLVCADGALHLIPSGGRAKVDLRDPTEGGWSFAIWA
ncbi:hypothetical protein CI109_105785 [Kwoniella shandongensis]|uniref:Uncharacterized protein n=1 Tax=Kwoniella shandongensis TaxID=1734106 RepID=A0A5M6C454_9TREE|nr:uncharacterized protein CI109_003124 [Kwoniella shandongensis]KAA5528592.1 hypothetical protein CI109_003124 [Kwoniella shandongensis]